MLDHCSKEQCTSNEDGRSITRWVDEHFLERMEERLKANAEIMQERTQLVAHPFGTFKPPMIRVLSS